jgi:hypothetical protein
LLVAVYRQTLPRLLLPGIKQKALDPFIRKTGDGPQVQAKLDAHIDGLTTEIEEFTWSSALLLSARVQMLLPAALTSYARY